LRKKKKKKVEEREKELNFNPVFLMSFYI